MTINLKVSKRSIIGRGVRSLRKKNLIPAVVYGHDFESQNIEVDKILFEKIFHQVGKNTIIDLIIDGKKTLKVLIRAIQNEPLKGNIIHVDFYRIKEKEEVIVEVDLKFIGEAPAVKEKGGVLVHNLTNLEIEALPNDLIHQIEVDISCLKDFHDLIRVEDIKIPANIKVLQDQEEVVVSISAPRKEEEEVLKPTVEAVEPVEAKSEEKKGESVSADEKAE